MLQSKTKTVNLRHKSIKSRQTPEFIWISKANVLIDTKKEPYKISSIERIKYLRTWRFSRALFNNLSRLLSIMDIQTIVSIIFWINICWVDPDHPSKIKTLMTHKVMFTNCTTRINFLTRIKPTKGFYKIS